MKAPKRTALSKADHAHLCDFWVEDLIPAIKAASRRRSGDGFGGALWSDAAAHLARVVWHHARRAE